MPEEDVNELWLDMLDCLEEIKSDVKGNRRATRHVKILSQIMQQIGQTIVKLSKKKGIFQRE